MSNIIQCDNCGKFIKYEDIGNGATHKMITPDTDYTSEEWESICKKCNTIDEGKLLNDKHR